MWVTVSSIGKIFCLLNKRFGFRTLAYTKKKKLVSYKLDDKEQYSWSGCYRSKFYCIFFF